MDKRSIISIELIQLIDRMRKLHKIGKTSLFFYLKNYFLFKLSKITLINKNLKPPVINSQHNEHEYKF